MSRANDVAREVGARERTGKALIDVLKTDSTLQNGPLGDKTRVCGLGEELNLVMYPA